MAIALAPVHAPAASLRIACCADRADDARRLASAAAHVVPPGLVLDIGCGAGGIAVPLLEARADLRVHGVEIDGGEAERAGRQARHAGVAGRLSIQVADALTAALPPAVSAVVNPPMLPGEPGWLVAGEERTRPFAHAILERLAAIPTLSDVWIHVFDFLGVDVPHAPYPTLARTAAEAGFEIGYPHRGWRAIGPDSAVRGALPTLARLFPAAPVRVGGAVLPLADLPAPVPEQLLIGHTIARLHRPTAPKGGLA